MLLLPCSVYSTGGKPAIFVKIGRDVRENEPVHETADMGRLTSGPFLWKATINADNLYPGG